MLALSKKETNFHNLIAKFPIFIYAFKVKKTVANLVYQNSGSVVESIKTYTVINYCR